MKIKKNIVSIIYLILFVFISFTFGKTSGEIETYIKKTKVDNKPVVEEIETVEENIISDNDSIISEEQVNTLEVQESYQEPLWEVVYPSNRITIPGVLDNYLMSDDGDNYYLNRDIWGNYDGVGVPYVDFRTDFTTRKTIIYSHSSQQGNGPFQALQNYHNNYNYYLEHPYITVTYNGNTYTYQIFSVYVSIADSEDSEGLEYFHRMYYNDLEWSMMIQKYKNNSEYDTGVSVNENDKILILQTCSMDLNYYQKYYRYNLLIMGKLI